MIDGLGTQKTVRAADRVRSTQVVADSYSQLTALRGQDRAVWLYHKIELWNILLGVTNKGRTVLFADDHEAILRLVSRLLTRSGYDVVTTRHIPQVLSLLGSGPRRPHVLMLDLTLPRPDELDEIARVTQGCHGIPLIITSGYSAEDMKRFLHGIQPADFLEKPFSKARLLNSVQSVLRCVG